MKWRVDGSEAQTASPETEWEKRMNLPQAHGNKTRPIFSYCNRWKGGGEFVGLSGSGAGQKRWFCAAIIHNGVIGFFIGFIPGWKLKKTINYMLCIIALSCFFSGASFLLLVGGLKQWFWKNNTVNVGWIAKSVTEKKQQQGGLCGSLQKDYASHEVRMVRIFAGWWFALRSCP